MSFQPFLTDNGLAFVPDGTTIEQALVRTRYLAIVAHNDDDVINAAADIIAAYAGDPTFGVVVVNHGGGCQASGPYIGLTKQQIIDLRPQEQAKAAIVGNYSFVGMLRLSNEEVLDPSGPCGRALATILNQSKPIRVVTHNPFDKHRVHVGTLARTLEAIRSMPAEVRPKELLGGEVWGSLDWAPTEIIVRRLVGRISLVRALLGCYDSQITGGKRYDEATIGRWRCNATFAEQLEADAAEYVSLFMNLSVLINTDVLLVDFIQEVIGEFRGETMARLRQSY